MISPSASIVSDAKLLKPNHVCIIPKIRYRSQITSDLGSSIRSERTPERVQFELWIHGRVGRFKKAAELTMKYAGG